MKDWKRETIIFGEINYRICVIFFLLGTTVGCATTDDLRQRMVSHCYTYASSYDSVEFSNCMQRLERQNAISHACLRNSIAFFPGTRRDVAYSQCMMNIMR